MKRPGPANRGTRIASLLASTPNALYRLGRTAVGRPSTAELYYVVPGANWAIDWDGHYITSGIRDRFGWPAHLTSTPQLLVDHILHYGELWSFVNSVGSRRNVNNTVVATVFHGDRHDEFPEVKAAIDKMIAHAAVVARFVTASRLMEGRLIRWGIPPEKIVRIPLGVDLSRFHPGAPERTRDLRRRFGIPADRVCIGSFQKDGRGWAEGLSPKLEKGPDTFLRVIERLSRQHRIFVLLTGPARGYVSRGLANLGVPYRHEIVEDYQRLPDYYHCLDVCLITSREEGGPKSVLEALAMGVPVVSTRVGLAPDLIQHGYNGFLEDSEDVEGLADLVSRLAQAPELAKTLAENGLRSIGPYDWGTIAARYYEEIYRPLLAEMGYRTGAR